MERKNPFLLLDSSALPPSSEKPLEVCLIRGSAVESRHRVHVMVMGKNGEVPYHWGNGALPFFPRSAVKLLQAATWVRHGIEKDWKLSDEELALACSSHEGEGDHVNVVSKWLGKLGLDESALECGAHLPYNEKAAHSLIRSGAAASQLHNNCSGKHSGFLSMCRCREWETRAYTSYDHPLQEAVRKTMGEFYGVDLTRAPWGIDGCGIPTYSVPLEVLATAMAKLANPGELSADLKVAVGKLNAAIAAKPRFVGGTTSFCSQVVAESEGRVFAKLGAEGVYGAWIPKAGLGLAMKCEDGNSRATEVAMAAVLRNLGYPLSFYSPLVRRWTGEVVGQFVCA